MYVVLAIAAGATLRGMRGLARTSSSSMTDNMSALILATSSGGRLAGATMPYQVSQSTAMQVAAWLVR